MSKAGSLHYQLCEKGAQYLLSEEGTEPFCSRNRYATVELVSYCTEQADVWATNGSHSTVIEVKTSIQDFNKDAQKYWRSEECLQEGYGFGDRRYYLCPEGLIPPEKLPNGWGLLYWNPETDIITKIMPSQIHKTNHTADVSYLCSIMRKQGIKPQIFNFRNKNEKKESAKY